MPSRHENQLDPATGLYRIGKPTKDEQALGYLNSAMEGLRYAAMYLPADDGVRDTLGDIAACIQEVDNRIRENAATQKDPDNGK